MKLAASPFHLPVPVSLTNPVFRAAYNAWEHESKTNTMSRLLAIVKHALDAVTWSIHDGDGRLAYTLLKDLGLLTRIQESLTDPRLLKSPDAHRPPRPAPLPQPPTVEGNG